jgi:asparagine synthase (glutamine-hydrolysing)
MSARDTRLEVRLHGYCELGPAALAERVEAEGPESLSLLDGSFVVEIAPRGFGDPARVLSSSAHGYYPWYYAWEEGRLWHGPCVLDLVRAGLRWEWSYEALGDLFTLDQLIGDRTLHPRVRRLPQATVLRADNGAPTLAQRPFDALHPRGESTPEAALDALRASVGRWATADTTVLCMSAGMDSRVLLACLLAEGHRPHLLVGGVPEATDVVVSRAIAKGQRLPIQVVEPTLADYLEAAPRVAALTSGTKNAIHWHTYLFAAQAGLSTDATLFVGTAGEWARTDYFPVGMVARAADRMPPALVHRLYWPARLKKQLKREEAERLHPALARSLTEGMRERYGRLAASCPGGFLDGLDRFFLEERVRGFHAQSYKLYEAVRPTRVPFIDRTWVTRVRGLDRSWRLGSNWHRYALERACPELMRYPEGARYDHVARREPPLGWVPKASAQARPYIPYREWFREPRFVDHLMDRAAWLEPVAPRSLVERLCKSQRETGGREKLLGMLAVLAAWSELVATAGQRKD